MRASILVLSSLAVACGGATPDAEEPSSASAESAWEVAEVSCEGGENHACYDAAGWFSGESSQYPDPQAEGPEPDLSRMVENLQHACERQDEDACEWMLSVVLVNPDLSATSNAIERLGVVCGGGDALSCVILGVLVEGTDPVASAAAFEAGCDGDIREGCYRAGSARLDSDPPAGRALLERGCDETELWGCIAFGRALAEGVGGAADVGRAREVVGWVCSRDRAKAGARGDEAPSESCDYLETLD